MKIVDTFMFHNEYEMLEIRLSILYDHVDRFVIVEADHSHSAVYKGFNLEKNMDRYKKWADKIFYIKAEGSTSSNGMENDEWQRDHMARGWTDLGQDDVILVTDLDEIIRPETIEFIKNTDYGCYLLNMPAFYFKFNYLDTKPDWHYKAWGRAFRGFQDTGRGMRIRDWVPGKESVRLHHAGWHFGWLGNNDFVKHKIRSFAHTEINTPEIVNNVDIAKHIAEGRDHFRPENVTWVAVNFDEYFPKYLLDNKEKYKNFILHDTGKTVQDFWTAEILETAPR